MSLKVQIWTDSPSEVFSVNAESIKDDESFESFIARVKSQRDDTNMMQDQQIEEYLENEQT